MPGFNRITTVFLAAGCLLLSSCSQSPPPEDQPAQAQPSQRSDADLRSFEVEGREATPYEYIQRIPDSLIAFFDERLRYDLKQYLTPEEFNSLSQVKRRALNSAKADAEPEAKECLVGVNPLTNRRLSLLETVEQFHADELAEFSAETKACILKDLTQKELSQLPLLQQQSLQISKLLP